MPEQEATMPLTIDATTTEWISVSDVMAHANITDSTQVSEVALIRDAAQDAIEGLIGPVLWRTVTETVTSSGSVVLGTLPVVSITSLTYGGANVTYTPRTGGILTDVTVTGDVVVTYVAGRTSVPAAAVMAGLLTASHLWKTQLGNAPGGALPSEPQVSEFVPFGADAVPPRAMGLLEAAGLLALPGVA